MEDSTNLPAPTGKPFTTFGFRGTDEQLLTLLADGVEHDIVGSQSYASMYGVAVDRGLIGAAA